MTSRIAGTIRKIHIDKEYESIELKNPRKNKKKKSHSKSWYLNSSLRKRRQDKNGKR